MAHASATLARSRRRSAHDGASVFLACRRGWRLRQRFRSAPPRSDPMSQPSTSATRPVTIDVPGFGLDDELPTTESPLLKALSTTIPAPTLTNTPPA